MKDEKHPSYSYGYQDNRTVMRAGKLAGMTTRLALWAGGEIELEPNEIRRYISELELLIDIAIRLERKR